MGFRWVSALAFVAVTGAGAVGGFAANEYQHRQQQRAEAVQAAAQEAAAQAPTNRAIAILRDNMRDPESVQVRDVWLRGAFLCGAVNARNSMGGYVGFTRFIVAQSGEEAPMIDPTEDQPTIFGTGYARWQERQTAFINAWATRCLGQPPAP